MYVQILGSEIMHYFYLIAATCTCTYIINIFGQFNTYKLKENENRRRMKI